MKLIAELTEEVEYLSEDIGGKKHLYITGPFAIAEEVNKNNRFYPRSVMERALNEYIDARLKTRTAYGELGHPPGPKINEDRIALLATNLDWDKNRVIGKARILDTPMGKIVEGIMEGGGKLGVSTRALGSVKANSKGINEVQDDLNFRTIADVVTDPSGPGCFVNGIMENVEFFYDAARGTYIEEHIDDIKKDIKKMSLREINEKKFILFENFLAGLSKKS